jgi:hypothetical protein
MFEMITDNGRGTALVEKHTYNRYEDYNKAADEFAKDTSVKTMRTLCNRTQGLFEIEVERKKSNQRRQT